MAEIPNPATIFDDPKPSGSAGSAEGGIETVTPGTGTTPASDGTAKGKRGRKPGSKNQQKAPQLSLDGVSTILLSAHALLAGIAKAPELELDAGEAKALATGIIDVAKYYPVALDPKTLAWINLAMISGAIYGTRIYTIMHKAPKAKPEAATLETGNVRNLKPN